MKYCPRFYEYLYVDNNEGYICVCPWMEPKNAFIGNLMKDDIAEAYNSEYANFLRKTMDEQSFKFCRPEACPHLQNNDLEEITTEEYENRKQKSYYPTEINMAYDFVCNQSCETCRPSAFVPPKNYAEQMKIIHEKLAPCLNTAKRITASGHGDPFASKYMMEVLENLRPTNRDLSILLETNGVFFDEKHWERIKHLADYKLEVVVTINSFDKFIYKHISRGGNYERMMHNLEFMSQLRRENKISILANSFVIQDRNFREIPTFIKRSFENYAFDRVVLKPVYQWGTMDENVYWFKDVLNPMHPYHTEYLEIIQDPMLSDSRVYNFGGNTSHTSRPYPCEDSVKFPYGAIKKDSRIILYGAGKIGREYARQLNKTQYCKIVLWIDKKTCDDDCIVSPNSLEEIKSSDYDSIVLATNSPIFEKEMREVLEGFKIPNEKVVSNDCCC